MALLSHMARLGSSQPAEVYDNIDDLAAGFDLDHFGAAPTKFDEADLVPLSARVLQNTEFAAVATDIAALGVPDDRAEAFWQVVRGNINARSEMAVWWTLFRDGAAPLVDEDDREFVAQALGMLGDAPYGPDTWGAWTTAVKEATGRKGKGLFMPLRKAVTGRERGPEMADVMPLLQKKPTL